MKQILSALAFGLVSIGTVKAQITTTCPAPNPDDPNCFQTSRPSQGNPLTNWPPLPNQDCCNAIPLGLPYNVIENGVVIPQGASSGTLYPGCVADELPNPNNTCFGNNEKGTTWFKFQISPLNIPGSPTAVGSPAGKLRFKIIPKDVLDLPNYDPFNDGGSANFGNTDFDFLLFKIPADSSGSGAACTAIRNSPAFGNPTSVIASCNWTGTRGPTGLFEPGTGTESSTGPATRFNLPLDVKVGDIFYLAIDNFSVNVQGFDMDFRGLEAPDDQTAGLFDITSLSENESAHPVRLFPNPVKGESIHFTGSKISIINFLGQQALSQVNDKGLGEIHLGGLPNGVYFARITDGGKIYISKLVIER